MANIILDCDPGIDDALAILFALGAAELNPLAITTVSGNRSVDQTFENARNIVALAGRQDLRVFRGAYSPLDQTAPRSNLVHGEDGLGGVILPPSGAAHNQTPAALEILRILETEPAGSVTLVAIGPLTNLALVWALSPTIFRRARRLAIMGGAINVPGNVTPTAEFNFWADPLAADRVLQSGVDINLFSLDVTTQAICTAEWLDAIANLPESTSKPLAEMVAQYFREDFLLHDPCPVAWLIAPALFASTPMHIRVDTSAGVSAGNAIGWLPARVDCPGAVNAHVHTQVNCSGLLSLMLEKLQTLVSRGSV